MADAVNRDMMEEARLLGGRVALEWHAGRHMSRELMTAQQFTELLRDFDSALATIEQEFPADDERHQWATATRKRWFP